MLLAGRFIVALAVIGIGDSPYSQSWAARFFLLEGLGMFPVLPFVLNGCLGIWLGVQRHQNLRIFRLVITTLMALQVLIYLSTLTQPLPALQPFIMTVRAGGKFAWMLAVSHLMTTYLFRHVTGAIELLGRFALGSFILHRVFLQATEIGLHAINASINPELHFLILFAGTLVMTWLVCVIRLHIGWIDALFRRLAL